MLSRESEKRKAPVIGIEGAPRVEQKAILIVDDDEIIRETLRDLLESKGHVVETAETAKEAMEKSKARNFNLALLDIKLPDMEGTELLKKMHSVTPRMMKVMITAHGTLKNAMDSLNFGADAYLLKPINEKELLKIVDELKLSQERLIQAERLAAIGKTAGMVGHDLRNPLQGMTSTLYLAKQALKSPKAAGMQEVAGLLDTLDGQIAYMGKIVADLQDYVRPLAPALVETSLADLIRETFSTLQVPRSIKVIVQVEKGIGNVMVDAGLMRRVLTNLTTNSIQSMPKGGRLTIRADKTRDATVIAVEDTGVGIPEEDLGKLFSPFFTTKAKGQGLGLPVCKRLVEAHGGTITAKSKPGKGSTFTIKIPVTKKG